MPFMTNSAAQALQTLNNHDCLLYYPFEYILLDTLVQFLKEQSTLIVERVNNRRAPIVLLMNASSEDLCLLAADPSLIIKDFTHVSQTKTDPQTRSRGYSEGGVIALDHLTALRDFSDGVLSFKDIGGIVIMSVDSLVRRGRVSMNLRIISFLASYLRTEAPTAFVKAVTSHAGPLMVPGRLENVGRALQLESLLTAAPLRQNLLAQDMAPLVGGAQIAEVGFVDKSGRELANIFEGAFQAAMRVLYECVGDTTRDQITEPSRYIERQLSLFLLSAVGDEWPSRNDILHAAVTAAYAGVVCFLQKTKLAPLFTRICLAEIKRCRQKPNEPSLFFVKMDHLTRTSTRAPIDDVRVIQNAAQSYWWSSLYLSCPLVIHQLAVTSMEGIPEYADMQSATPCEKAPVRFRVPHQLSVIVDALRTALSDEHRSQYWRIALFFPFDPTPGIRQTFTELYEGNPARALFLSILTKGAEWPAHYKPFVLEALYDLPNLKIDVFQEMEQLPQKLRPMTDKGTIPTVAQSSLSSWIQSQKLPISLPGRSNEPLSVPSGIYAFYIGQAEAALRGLDPDLIIYIREEEHGFDPIPSLAAQLSMRRAQEAYSLLCDSTIAAGGEVPLQVPPLPEAARLVYAASRARAGARLPSDIDRLFVEVHDTFGVRCARKDGATEIVLESSVNTPPPSFLIPDTAVESAIHRSVDVIRCQRGGVVTPLHPLDAAFDVQDARALGVFVNAATSFVPSSEVATRRRYLNNSVGVHKRNIPEDTRQFVLIDSREFRAELPICIFEAKMRIKMVTIPVADYVVSTRVGIERKAVQDLILSLSSGRLLVQSIHLSAYFDVPILLIEGGTHSPLQPSAGDTRSETDRLDTSRGLKRAFRQLSQGLDPRSLSSTHCKLSIVARVCPSLRVLWASSPKRSAELIRQLAVDQQLDDTAYSARLGTVYERVDRSDQMDRLIHHMESLAASKTQTQLDVSMALNHFPTERSLSQKRQSLYDGGIKTLKDLVLASRTTLTPLVGENDAQAIRDFCQGGVSFGWTADDEEIPVQEPYEVLSIHNGPPQNSARIMSTAVACRSPLSQAIQNGIWMAIETLGIAGSKDPTLDDFAVSWKTHVNPYVSASCPTQQANGPASFKTYCPLVFKRLRALFGVNPIDYALSLCGERPLYTIPSNGKSGATFFYSHDAAYIVKSMTHSEAKLLRHILPSYYTHFVRHPHTLICRYFSLFRIRLRGKKHYFCVMNNVFNTPRSLPVSAVFDLKGSTYQRITEESARSRGAVMKDLDFLLLRIFIHLAPVKRALLLQQLRIDSQFLETLGLIDYSLLLGIHERGASCDHRVVFRNPEEDQDNCVAHLCPPVDSPGASFAMTPFQLGRPVKLKQPLPSDCYEFSPFQSEYKAPITGPAGSCVRHCNQLQLTVCVPDTDFLSSPPSCINTTDYDVVATHRQAAAVSACVPGRRTADLSQFTVDDLTNPSASLFTPSSWIQCDGGTACDEGEKCLSIRHGGLVSVFQCEDGGMRSEDGQCVYIFGIVDLLTHYTLKKKMERFCKLRFQGRGVSVAPPALYAERFFSFIRNRVIFPAFASGEVSLSRMQAPPVMLRMGTRGGEKYVDRSAPAAVMSDSLNESDSDPGSL